MVELREECQQGSCAKFTHHFAHCQEKVEAGEGFKGEDCVEEMFQYVYIQRSICQLIFDCLFPWDFLADIA